jgi:hypothetical protein
MRFVIQYSRVKPPECTFSDRLMSLTTTTVREARALLHRFTGKLTPSGDTPRTMISAMGRTREALTVNFPSCSDIEAISKGFDCP